MQRRRLLLLIPVVPLSILVSRYLKALAPKPPQPVDYRGVALRLNQLAANIHTPDDARVLVDFIADIFSKQLLPALISSSIRKQIADTEFAAVINPHKLIPEQQIVETWNTFCRTIQAPPSCQVTAAEVHNLRDSLLTTTRLLWDRGSWNIWAAPAIYATQADGSIATGCRAIESARILWDLACMPDNLTSAHVRVSQGVLASELFSRAQKRPSTKTHKSYISAGAGIRNPVEVAEREYVASKGTKALNKAVQAMLNQLLA